MKTQLTIEELVHNTLASLNLTDAEYEAWKSIIILEKNRF